MMRQLSKGKLKTGEEMRSILVTPSQKDYRERALSLLGHKGQPWLWHIDQALSGKIQDLETRFYLGLVENDPICNITTSEYDRVGILGHVYTKPEHRRKGACTLLMESQMEDWKRRGGGFMLLMTECHSAPYWIYDHFGFRSVVPGSGLMQCSTHEGFLPKYFSPAPTNAVDYEWAAWPRLNLLSSCLEGEVLRSLAFRLFGPSSFEGPGIALKQALAEDPRARAKLLRSDKGAIVGWAFVLPDERWPGLNLLDFFVHPDFSDSAPILLQAIELPPGKSQCYVDATSAHRVEALQTAGFRREGILRAQFDHQGAAVDVAIYSTSV